jgi:hypothetical protein
VLAHAGEPANEVRLLECGLGRRHKHDADAVVARQLVEGGDTRLQERQGRGLRLVEHDHGLREVVQLAAARRPRGEQALEELDRRCDDDRGVSILRRLTVQILAA